MGFTLDLAVAYPLAAKDERGSRYIRLPNISVAKDRQCGMAEMKEGEDGRWNRHNICEGMRR